ncbi:MAG TPA: hypothetical protein VMU66_05375, partial [Gaiellales bacterium]|nr:hypothetical protein [Gaiellales bacterium]
MRSLPRELQHLGALRVGLEGPDPKRTGASEDPVLSRPDPLPADLHDLAGAERVVERAPADAIACLEHHHGVPRGDQVGRRRQPREAGADHDHVGPPSALGRAPLRDGGRRLREHGRGRAGGGARDRLAAGNAA